MVQYLLTEHQACSLTCNMLRLEYISYVGYVPTSQAIPIWAALQEL